MLILFQKDILFASNKVKNLSIELFYDLLFSGNEVSSNLKKREQKFQQSQIKNLHSNYAKEMEEFFLLIVGKFS